MKSTIIMILLFWGLNSIVFSADSTKTDCLAQAENRLKPDQPVSILKKDLNSISGYFRGVKEDTLLFSYLKKSYYKTNINKVALDEITYISYDERGNTFDGNTAALLFLGGAAAGAIFGLTVSDLEAKTNVGDDIDPLKVVIAAAVGGTISILLYRLFTGEKPQKLYIRCE